MPRIVSSCGDHFGSTSADLLGISIPIRAVLADQSASVFGSGIRVICALHNNFFNLFLFVEFENRKFFKEIFSILTIHKPLLGSYEVPQKMLARSVQPF